MPTLRFHAVDAEKILPVSDSLLKELMRVYKLPADHFNLEIIPSQFIVNGSLKDGFPIVEVCAFQRTYDIQDEVAIIVYQHLKNAGYEDSELYFSYPNPRGYYGNGQHY
ncbi:MAG: DUF1904 family protein [Bacteroidales bacterium]